MKFKLIVIFLLAFFIRLIALNQSLWLDEATTAQVVKTLDFLDIVKKFSPSDFHPPLYYFFMKLWTGFFGYSEIALRMPSVIFSLLTGWVIYLIGGIWAAVFFLFNPLIVYYSQEARMYMMVTFLLTAALYYLMGPVRNFPQKWHRSAAGSFWGSPTPATRQIILFNLFIFLSFLTFYGLIFFIAAIYLYLVFKKQWKLLFLTLPGFLLAFLVVSPLLYQQFLNSQIVTKAVVNWRLVLGQANFKNLLLIPIKFTTGRIEFQPILGLWTAFVFYPIIRSSLEIRNWKFPTSLKLRGAGKIKNEALLFFFIVPIILGFLASFFTPLLQYFRFLYLIPILSLLLGQFRPSQSEWQRWVVATGFIGLSLVYLLNPRFHREDWRSLTVALPEKPVYMIPSSSDPLKYYSPDQKILEIRAIRSIGNLDHEIVVIPYTAEIHGINYKSILMKKGYVLSGERSFREVTYEIWSR